MADRRLLVALDTATSRPTIALIGPQADVLGERQWESRHRHGEELLQRLDEVLAEAGATAVDVDGVIVGLGPGSFTGLRIGLATAKTIAYSRAVPLVGVSSTMALGLAAADGQAGDEQWAVTLPAGARDRYVHRVTVGGDRVREDGPPRLVVPGPEFEALCGESLLGAIDLAGADDIADEAVARGETALAGLGRALAVLGTTALAERGADDVARLVPAYVALPRGIERAAAEMTWSPDLR